MKRVTGILSFVVVTAICVGNAGAALVGYEGFEGYTIGASPTLQSGTGNMGFSGAYSNSNGHTVQAGTLSYTNGGTLITSPGSLKSTGFGQVTRPLATSLATNTMTGEELWVAYLFKSGPNREDANIVRFYYGPSGVDGQRIDLNAPRGFPDTTQQAVNVGAWFNNSPNGGGALFNPVGQVDLLVLQYTLDDANTAGNQGVMRAYVNPTIGGAAPAIGTEAVSFTGLGGFDSPDNLRLFSFGGGDYAVTWDELRWGTSFADVTPVIPEPTTFVLLGSSGLALAASRRRAA